MTIQQEELKEIVGIFDNYETLQAAIDELSISGFGRHELSVVGSEKEIRDRFGGRIPEQQELMDDPRTPRDVNITPEEIGVEAGAVISGSIMFGVIAALIAAGGVTVPAVIPATLIGITSGGVIGGVIAKFIGDRYAQHIQNLVDQGGLVLWVRTPDLTKRLQARHILEIHGATNIHSHDLELENYV